MHPRIKVNNTFDQSMKKHVLNYQFKIHLLNIFSGHWPIGAPRPDKLPNIYFHPGGPNLSLSYLADIIFWWKKTKSWTEIVYIVDISLYKYFGYRSKIFLANHLNFLIWLVYLAERFSVYIHKANHGILFINQKKSKSDSYCATPWTVSR